MASSLSDEEFHRMQIQLLELKSANYELDRKCKKFETDLGESARKIEILDRDLAKANKVISKSKKAKETELLVQENESFQGKLLSQEEEFRLQNQTLMQEISSLVAANEDLEQKCRELGMDEDQSGENNRSAGRKTSEMEDQLRELQAQNFALQKNLTASQEKHEKEIANMKELLRVRTQDEGENDLRSTDDSEQNSEKVAMEEVTTDTQMADLQLSVDTEREENRLLKKQLIKSREQTDELEERLKKADEMVKRKQESYLLLQSEKDSLLEENKKKYQELQGARERDQKYYQDQISKLQQELEKSKQAQESLTVSLENNKGQHQKRVSELQKEIDTASIVTQHQLQEQNLTHQQKIKDLDAQLAGLKQKNDDLSAQLQESQRASQEAFSQLLAAQQERDSQIHLLQEVDKVAEKRKALLDELSIRYQKESDLRHEQSLAAEEKHQAEVKALQEEMSALQNHIQVWSKTELLVEDLQSMVRSLEGSKGQLESTLKDTQNELQKCQIEREEMKESLESQHQKEVESLREEHRTELITLKKDWEGKEVELQDEIIKLKETVSSLNQAIKDEVAEKRINEKKGMTMVKDLKRQLQSERKRAEKLQERLQEVLSESRSKSMEELFRPADAGDVTQGDGSSVSSLGTGAGRLRKDSSASGSQMLFQSPATPSSNVAPQTFDPSDDYIHLVRRLAEAQEEKWTLEEKVNHLETTNASMADDLMKKTAIIQHYVIHTHTAGGRQQPTHQGSGEDKRNLKKTMDLVKNAERHELQDMNRRLQLMLEETLTKNLHLQQDLETMSLELVRLSKIAAESGSSSCSQGAEKDSQGSAAHLEGLPSDSGDVKPQTVEHSSATNGDTDQS